MKNYHLFVGEDYYPEPGLGDYRGSFADVNEAIAEAQRLTGSEWDGDWARVIRSTPDGLETIWGKSETRGQRERERADYRDDGSLALAILIGQTLTSIEGMRQGSEEIRLVAGDTVWRMWHEQRCTEDVFVEDVCGDPADLIGSPIVAAFEETTRKPGRRTKLPDEDGYVDDDQNTSYTWTFYRLSTIKGTVVIRWYGTSNGFYSERVTVSKEPTKKGPTP